MTRVPPGPGASPAGPDPFEELPAVVPLNGTERELMLERVVTRGRRLRRQRSAAFASVGAAFALLLALPAVLHDRSDANSLIDQSPAARAARGEEPVDDGGDVSGGEEHADETTSTTMEVVESGAPSTAPACIEGCDAGGDVTMLPGRADSPRLPGDDVADPNPVVITSPPVDGPAITTPSTTTPVPETTTTVTPVDPCRNGHTMSCGPFVFDPPPAANEILSLSISPALNGSVLSAHLTADDPDAAVSADCWTLRVTRLGTGGTTLDYVIVGGQVVAAPGPCGAPPGCPTRYGAWTPPSSTHGHAETDFQYDFGAAGTYLVTVGHTSRDGTCDNDAYGSPQSATTSWTVA